MIFRVAVSSGNWDVSAVGKSNAKAVPTLLGVVWRLMLDNFVSGDMAKSLNPITLAPLSRATRAASTTACERPEEEMAGWRRDYPEAFERDYDLDTGVCLSGWLTC